MCLDADLLTVNGDDDGHVTFVADLFNDDCLGILGLDHGNENLERFGLSAIARSAECKKSLQFIVSMSKVVNFDV